MSAKRPFADKRALATDLREKVGLSNSYASELATGRRQPSLTLALRIEAALKIPPAAWVNRAAFGDTAEAA